MRSERRARVQAWANAERMKAQGVRPDKATMRVEVAHGVEAVMPCASAEAGHAGSHIMVQSLYSI